MSSSSITNHNRQLDELYQQLKDCLYSAETSDDLYQIVEQAKAFGKPLKYNNNPSWLAIVIFSIMIGIVTKFFAEQTIFCFISVFILVVFIIGTIGNMFKRRKSFKELSQDIFFEKVLFDNHLTRVDFNTSRLTRDLQNRFNDFIRGNDKREVLRLYSGQYYGEDNEFEYHYYKFHYVVKSEMTSTDSNGKTVTETKYSDYYRYGVFLDFPYIANLSLDATVPFRRGIYRPSSNQFNRYYRVYGHSEMEAAKFLKPMVVQAFEKIYPHFSNVYFQFNSDNELCMSFDDSNVLNYKGKYSLDEPDKFLTELKEPKIFTKLNVILNHIECLMTYSDNNFSIDK